VGISFGFLTTRSGPRHVGDTYSEMLARQLATAGVDSVVVTVGDRDAHGGTVRCADDAVTLLAGVDVVLVDHEVRGDDEADLVVVEAVEQLPVPVIVAPRRVPRVPGREQRQMLCRIGAAAQALVASSADAGARLAVAYQMAPRTVSVIPDEIRTPVRAAEAIDAGAPTMVTYGLVGPGRGLETVIDAMAALRSLAPRPRYRIVGPTDPSVFAHDGEAYRHSLMARTIDRGVAHMVSVAHARDTAVPPADVLVVARACAQQVTSRDVARALADGTPVVAVATPDAVGAATAAGIDRIVRAGDTAALIRVLRHLLTDVDLLATAAQRSRHGRSSAWARMVAQYQELADTLLAERHQLVR
jgi:glycosyltransferase involved in cell wall biosynthesis